MADQALQLEKVATLQRSSREQSEKVKLLEARVEALEQDNFALKDKASKLQEKVKVLPKRRKVFSSFFCLFRVVAFCSHVFLPLTELKSLLLRKDNDGTDLTNIMYRHTDAVEKLTKIKADADKQMVGDMKQIRELSQRLADLEVAAKVVVNMVEDEGVAEKSLLEHLR